MKEKLHIVLVGNYRLDKQESMKRFATMLEGGYREKGHTTEIWEPVVFFGSIFNATTKGLGKWMGYIDKWIIFPILLRIKLLKLKNKKSNARYHICDHSNSPYLKVLPENRTLITCHDVLAIRGALGYTDAYCPASTMGEFLQKWILRNLIKSKKLVTVSYFTLGQLKSLAKSTNLEDKNWKVIHNAFNAKFEVIDSRESNLRLKELNLNVDDKFILHVGSALPRKNRELLLNMLIELKDQWTGKVYLTGKAIDENLSRKIADSGLQHRVISIVKPSHKNLVALYNRCEAFIFPSFSEGFGWPVIEAQACGAPVIASNFEPMPEVSGGKAIHVHPENAKGFADAFLKLQENSFKAKIINGGYENIDRFNINLMIVSYLKMHKEI